MHILLIDYFEEALLAELSNALAHGLHGKVHLDELVILKEYLDGCRVALKEGEGFAGSV